MYSDSVAPHNVGRKKRLNAKGNGQTFLIGRTNRSKQTSPSVELMQQVNDPLRPEGVMLETGLIDGELTSRTLSLKSSEDESSNNTINSLTSPGYTKRESDARLFANSFRNTGLSLNAYSKEIEQARRAEGHSCVPNVKTLTDLQITLANSKIAKIQCVILLLMFLALFTITGYAFYYASKEENSLYKPIQIDGRVTYFDENDPKEYEMPYFYIMIDIWSTKKTSARQVQNIFASDVFHIGSYSNMSLSEFFASGTRFMPFCSRSEEGNYVEYLPDVFWMRTINNNDATDDSIMGYTPAPTSRPTRGAEARETCIDSETYIDVNDNGCAFYSANDHLCGWYDVAQTTSSTVECCACGGGRNLDPTQSPSQSPTMCKDDPKFLDTRGENCDLYNENQDRCGAYDSLKDNINSRESCCECRIATDTPTQRPSEVGEYLSWSLLISEISEYGIKNTPAFIDKTLELSKGSTRLVSYVSTDRRRLSDEVTGVMAYDQSPRGKFRVEYHIETVDPYVTELLVWSKLDSLKAQFSGNSGNIEFHDHSFESILFSSVPTQAPLPSGLSIVSECHDVTDYYSWVNCEYCYSWYSTISCCKCGGGEYTYTCKDSGDFSMNGHQCVDYYYEPTLCDEDVLQTYQTSINIGYEYVAVERVSASYSCCGCHGYNLTVSMLSLWELKCNDCGNSSYTEGGYDDNGECVCGNVLHLQGWIFEDNDCSTVLLSTSLKRWLIMDQCFAYKNEQISSAYISCHWNEDKDKWELWGLTYTSENCEGEPTFSTLNNRECNLFLGRYLTVDFEQEECFNFTAMPTHSPTISLSSIALEFKSSSYAEVENWNYPETGFTIEGWIKIGNPNNEDYLLTYHTKHNTECLVVGLNIKDHDNGWLHWSTVWDSYGELTHYINGVEDADIGVSDFCGSSSSHETQNGTLKFGSADVTISSLRVHDFAIGKEDISRMAGNHSWRVEYDGLLHNYWAFCNEGSIGKDWGLADKSLTVMGSATLVAGLDQYCSDPAPDECGGYGLVSVGYQCLHINETSGLYGRRRNDYWYDYDWYYYYNWHYYYNFYYYYYYYFNYGYYYSNDDDSYDYNYLNSDYLEEYYDYSNAYDSYDYDDLVPPSNYLGHVISLDACINYCEELDSCEFLLYGFDEKQGECWMEDYEDCTSGFYVSGSYLLYQKAGRRRVSEDPVRNTICTDNAEWSSFNNTGDDCWFFSLSPSVCYIDPTSSQACCECGGGICSEKDPNPYRDKNGLDCSNITPENAKTNCGHKDMVQYVYSALDSCCNCVVYQPQCEDLNYTDGWGNNCSYYTLHPEMCGLFDVSELSMESCCACNGADPDRYNGTCVDDPLFVDVDGHTCDYYNTTQRCDRTSSSGADYVRTQHKACCTCSGGCTENLNIGYVDIIGRTCSFYRFNPELCGHYDIFGGLDSIQSCCGCQRGCFDMLEPSGQEWMDIDGYTCAEYHSFPEDCGLFDDPWSQKTSLEACCACRGIEVLAIVDDTCSKNESAYRGFGGVTCDVYKVVPEWCGVFDQNEGASEYCCACEICSDDPYFMTITELTCQDFLINPSSCTVPESIDMTGKTALEACGCACKMQQGCSDNQDWKDVQGRNCEYYNRYPQYCGHWDTGLQYTSYVSCCACAHLTDQTQYTMIIGMHFEPTVNIFECNIRYEWEDPWENFQQNFTSQMYFWVQRDNFKEVGFQEIYNNLEDVTMLELPRTESLTFEALEKPFPWDIISERVNIHNDKISAFESMMSEQQPPPGRRRYGSGSCEGNCGGNGGDCWCDTSCFQYGDCCDDVHDHCEYLYDDMCGDDYFRRRQFGYDPVNYDWYYYSDYADWDYNSGYYDWYYYSDYYDWYYYSDYYWYGYYGWYNYYWYNYQNNWWCDWYIDYSYEPDVITASPSKSNEEWAESMDEIGDDWMNTQLGMSYNYKYTEIYENGRSKISSFITSMTSEYGVDIKIQPNAVVYNYIEYPRYSWFDACSAVGSYYAIAMALFLLFSRLIMKFLNKNAENPLDMDYGILPLVSKVDYNRALLDHDTSNLRKVKEDLQKQVDEKQKKQDWWSKVFSNLNWAQKDRIHQLMIQSGKGEKSVPELQDMEDDPDLQLAIQKIIFEDTTKYLQDINEVAPEVDRNLRRVHSVMC